MVAHNAPTQRLPALPAASADDADPAQPDPDAPPRGWLWRVLKLLAMSPAGLGLLLLATGCAVDGDRLTERVAETSAAEHVVVPFADTSPDPKPPQGKEPPAKGQMGSTLPCALPDPDPGVHVVLRGVPSQGAPARQVGFPEAPQGSDAGRAPEPTPQTAAPPPAKAAGEACASDADCPALAKGCLIQGCLVDSGGVGTCEQVAFVCQCLPGQDTSCDDKNPCTTDTCSDVGACSFALGLACDDGNPCTDDTCEVKHYVGVAPAALCSHTPDDAQPCDDGDVCTETSTCGAGACLAGELAECTDNDACTVDTCDSDLGCVFVVLDSCGG